MADGQNSGIGTIVLVMMEGCAEKVHPFFVWWSYGEQAVRGGASYNIGKRLPGSLFGKSATLFLCYVVNRTGYSAIHRHHPFETHQTKKANLMKGKPN